MYTRHSRFTCILNTISIQILPYKISDPCSNYYLFWIMIIRIFIFYLSISINYIIPRFIIMDCSFPGIICVRFTVCIIIISYEVKCISHCSDLCIVFPIGKSWVSRNYHFQFQMQLYTVFRI